MTNRNKPLPVITIHNHTIEIGDLFTFKLLCTIIVARFGKKNVPHGRITLIVSRCHDF